MTVQGTKLEILGDAGQILEKVADQARPYYDPDLPYHNWDGHIVPTFNESMELCGKCEDNGLTPSRLVVGSAVLLHDAGFDRQLDTEQFGSKEEYSAHIATAALGELEFDQEDIEAVKVCILSTRCDEDCPTLESKIVRRADLANIAGAYKDFILCTLKLMEETKMLTGQAPKLPDWKRRTCDIIGRYLAVDLSFGDFERDEQGQYSFLTVSHKNIRKLKYEHGTRLVKLLGEQATKYAPFLGDTLKIR